MPTRRIAWICAVWFWTLLALISGVQDWIAMIRHGHSVPRLLFYNLAVWEAWLILSAGLVWLSRRFPVVPLRPVPLLVHLAAATVFGVGHALYWRLMMIWLRPFDKMMSELSMRKAILTTLPLEWILYLLALGCTLAFEYYDRYRERTVHAAQLERSLSDARLHALKLQIQPHFLFNTLNAISSLVRNGRSDEAVTMIAGLADLLRYTLDRADHQRVTLDEEIGVLRRYLEIQRARFPDRMSFQIEMSAEAGRGAVPIVLLQPIAENAVRHGIAPSAAPGVVEIRAFRSGDRLQIDVFNTGSLAAAGGEGIGLRNTRERLRHLYGEDWRFDLSNTTQGVLASISIPWSEPA
jgi:two-component system, LytTR family, sensor kinase